MKYRRTYTATIEARPRGAIGIFEPRTYHAIEIADFSPESEAWHHAHKLAHIDGFETRFAISLELTDYRELTT